MGMVLHRFGGLLALALEAAALLLACAGSAPSAHANAFVQMDFNITSANRQRGTVFIELFDDRPLTQANFLKYVDGGHYDNSLMHRLARPFGQPYVLQGGGFYPKYRPEPPPLNTSLDRSEAVDLDGIPVTTVPNEFSKPPLRSNVRGTLAMARQPGRPDSATSQFFFNLNDNGGVPPGGLDFQDGGFTVFASVVGDGMSLINAYSGLAILNLNEDVNDDGQPDNVPGDPFAEVPVLPAGSSFLPLTLARAEQINYYGSGPATTVPGGDLTSSGRDAFIDAGAVISGTDPVGIAAGRTLGVREGIWLQRTLVNRGTLAPGLQLGSIAVDSYEQWSTGTLDIQLAGTTAGTHYDQLIVGGVAFLGGRLDVSLAGGFRPTHGDSFTVLSAGLLIGNFIAGELPLLSNGLVWSYNRSGTAFTLSVARADFNRNGIVDTADFIIWRNTFNQSGTALAADGNGDGKVDNADYTIWRSNFGNIAGTPPGSGSLASAPVPEPATMWLLVAIFTPLICRRTSSRYR
jgi:cyclophilin family peptidyl-prolyl cis-trans isomerase